MILGRWPGSHIRLGAGCSLISSSRRATASTLYAPVRLRTYAPTARIDLAEGVQLSGTAITARSCTISIGKDTMVGPNCVITDSDFHAHWPAETRHIEPAFEAGSRRIHRRERLDRHERSYPQGCDHRGRGHSRRPGPSSSATSLQRPSSPGVPAKVVKVGE